MSRRATPQRSTRGFTLLAGAGLVAAWLFGAAVAVAVDAAARPRLGEVSR